MAKQFVYVDALRIQSNREKNAVSPPILVTGGGNFEPPRAGCRIKILGPCEIVYSKAGLVNGAHVVVVTEAEIEIEREYGK